ncbi:cytidine monophosphate-N-acetylneuraminic acid hydroxylase-like [Eumetopias jubatus]|uniref:cytidine monophosphate-N-acetylneuraminic acid hydroxylase-like n=1 Tax=Eumetopias jubatus TaxID=34886 RepID=UPI0010170D98|nr:cytidine monophosphate-N-acetylneuraminic acid hydroxylase-like [Eumetopias jubatus]
MAGPGEGVAGEVTDISKSAAVCDAAGRSLSEIWSRVDVIRHMVKNGLRWDDLYIGFQTWLQQDPDIDHHLFWNHFQIKLPLAPPNWRSFLMHCG